MTLRHYHKKKTLKTRKNYVLLSGEVGMAVPVDARGERGSRADTVCLARCILYTVLLWNIIANYESSVLIARSAQLAALPRSL